MGRSVTRRSLHSKVMAGMLGIALCAVFGHVSPAGATAGAKIQGKIVGADTGEPVGFAEVVLLPQDSTLHPVGGLTNSDGTYLLEAPPGRYALKLRALSYTQKRIDGIVLEAGKLLPYSTALTSEAIKNDKFEIVVDARAVQNNEASMLSARRKAVAVGDAVSAEQVRKSPDKDAAEVLRRVTGLSVADGKYVFVRGLGERYSSTEVDGVRIASPEQNKRVVPLDLLPASLLEDIVVQKTYTADRPGEFGGGDVQVHTKDFPGRRTWQFSTSQGYTAGATFKDHWTYASSDADLFGFGADSRKIPDAVYSVAGNSKLVLRSANSGIGYSRSTLAGVATSFDDVWSPRRARTIPNAGYSATYGDEIKLFGRPLGGIASLNLSRSFDHQLETRRLFQSKTDTLYDYGIDRSTESVQMGGISGLSYRLSPRHTLHLRALYTNSADDEVRIYEGPDHNREDPLTGTFLVHRSMRLMYVQRNVLSGTLEGQHEFAHLLGTSFDWKLTRSMAKRLQPDRREVIYDHRYNYDPDGNLVPRWVLGSPGGREYGDLRDDGWGTTVSTATPFHLDRLGTGKVALGYDRQTKSRDNFYRRFNIYPKDFSRLTLAPEDVFGPGAFAGDTTTIGYVEETTLDIDNYRAHQRVEAGYVSADLPFGSCVRGNVGARYESGFQDVRSYDLFDPSRITQRGTVKTRDWLPTGNLTWAVTRTINLRLGASSTLSRPDLNEMSPSPALEYVGGFRVAGNPALKRARIDNYDLRVEAFPGLSEVLAAGVFHKDLHDPIEQVIQAGSPYLLIPRNSESGRNTGVELEARTGLGRIWGRLRGLSINANASFISSVVRLQPQVSRIGSAEHPLQGQAQYLVNASLNYTARNGRMDATVLVSAVGKRLTALAAGVLPDIYEQPSTSLDATLNFSPYRNSRVKFSAKNLFDPRIRQLQDDLEESVFQRGRAYSLAVSYGS